MPFVQSAASKRFTRSDVDLSDVLGSPGFDSPSGLAHELERALDRPWTQLARGDGLFLDGQVGRGAAAAGELLGAFAPEPRVARTVTDIVLEPGRATGTDDVVSVMDSATGRHEVRQQLVRGAPVLGATYRMHYDSKETMTITGRPLRDLSKRDPGARPGVPESEVRRAMRQALDLPTRTPIDLELVVFPVNGKGVWAYKGECVLRNPPGDLRIFVRADDLRLMLSYDVACSAFYGEATVYPISPSRTPEPRPTLLYGLGPEPPDFLVGALAAVLPTRGTAITNATRDYRVEPNHPGFDEVSAYHHVQAAAQWFGEKLPSTVFDAHPFQPLKVFTGDRTVGSSVAIFIPATGQMRLSNAQLNPARSADIIFHEFTHAIIDRICRLNRSAGMQSRILSEGFADYFASTALDDPRFGDYVKGAPAGARNCSDLTLEFPAAFDSAGEPYRSGAVWAAVLWEIRSVVGARIADVLALNSLYYLAPNSTLDDAIAALIKTDRTLFLGQDGHGRHEDVINQKYSARLP